MTDTAAVRRTMVDGQVRTVDVTDRRLLAAMLDLPRERFFPADKAALAYLDLDGCVSGGGAPARWLLKPMVLAKLIQAAEIGERDRVLDVGCATGYSAAILSKFAERVVGLEQDEALAQQARATLAAMGCNNVQVVAGALSRGWAAAAPYDAIVLEGSVEVIPEVLASQLGAGGRLLCVLGNGPAAKAMLYRSIEGEISGRAIFDAAAPSLPGFSKPPAFVF
jgi:protein-L-isoaspartate(D-aspartate) O-methyltransferase